MQIRAAGISDVDMLCALSTETFADTYIPIVRYKPEVIHAYNRENFTVEKIAAAILSEGTRYFLASDRGEIVGYSKVVARQGHLELERLYLRKGAQGRGYGKKIFNFLRELAEKEKFACIRLASFERNLGAIAFYRGLGFQDAGERKFEFTWRGTLYQDRDLVLELRLHR